MPSKSVGETSEAIACIRSLNLAHGLDFEVWSLQTFLDKTMLLLMD
jgi:hypothetical protein